MDRVEVGGLKVDKELYDFVNDEAMPGTGIDQDGFWNSFFAILVAFPPMVVGWVAISRIGTRMSGWTSPLT